MAGNVRCGGHNVRRRPGLEGERADRPQVAVTAGGGQVSGSVLDLQDVVAGQNVTHVVKPSSRAVRARTSKGLLAEAEGYQEPTVCLDDLLLQIGFCSSVQSSDVSLGTRLLKVLAVGR